MFFVCHPKILHKHCFQLLLGPLTFQLPRETYAKFWGGKQRILWYVYGIFWIGPTWRAVLKLCAPCSFIFRTGLSWRKPLQEMFASKNKTQPVREVLLATWKMLNVEGMSETVQLLPQARSRGRGRGGSSPPRNFQTWINFCYNSGILVLKWTAANGS